MNGAEWKREKMAQIRAQIRIEEAILRSLRAELEELQWLNRQDAELRCAWDMALTADEQDLRDNQDLLVDIWLAGQHHLKSNGAAA